MIIAYGRMPVADDPESEYIECLRRAFCYRKSDFIVLDSNMRGQKFVAARAAWAIDKGWLYHSSTRGDEQSEELQGQAMELSWMAQGVNDGS